MYTSKLRNSILIIICIAFAYSIVNLTILNANEYDMNVFLIEVAHF